MKNITSLLMRVVFVTWLLQFTHAEGQTCANAPTGMIGWWRGEGTAADALEMNHGTLAGNATYTTGRVGQAFGFDGSGDGVRLQNLPALQIQNFTIEAWIKRGSTVKTSQSSDGGLLFAYGSSGYAFGLLDNGSLYLSKVGSGQVSASSQPQIVDTNFHHVAVTKTAESVLFYVDGNPYAAPDYDPGFAFGSNPSIGYRSDFSVNSFLGTIDEIAIYDHALGGTEIQEIYAAALGKCTPLTITAQPISQTLPVGGSTILSVQTLASGVTFQWFLNNNPLTDQTNAILSINYFSAEQAGSYHVVLSREGESLTSSTAQLTLASTACADASQGIISWWSANGDSFDAIVKNNGVLKGNAHFVDGISGLSFSLDGQGDGVTLGTANTLRLQNFTFEGWIKRSSIAQASQVAGGGVLLGCGSGGYAFGIKDDGALYLSAIGLSEVTVAAKVTDLEFHHVAVTKTNGVVNFYLDGIEYTASYYNPTFTFGTNIAIGARGDLLGSFLGQIDEFAIYNRALPAADVLAIYNASAAVKCFTAPLIVVQPIDKTVGVGNSASFAVVTEATMPPRFRWYFNDLPLPDATNNILNLTNIQSFQAGNYFVVASNFAGCVTSSIAHLTVLSEYVTVNNQIGTNFTFTNTSSVLIAAFSEFTNASIFYTLDGSEPDFNSISYAGPFSLSQSALIRAIVYDSSFHSFPTTPVYVTLFFNYPLTIVNPGGGSVALSPTGGVYRNDQIVNASATASNGWTFMGWSGDVVSTNSSLQITMERAKTIKAIFGTPVTTISSSNGSINVTPLRILHPYGSLVQVVGLPNTNYAFALWGGSINGNTNPYPLTVTNTGTSISALFSALATNRFTLIVVPNGNGSVNLNPRANSYTNGQVVVASPAGIGTNRFLTWTGDASGKTNPMNIVMTGNRFITANFTGGEYPVRFNGISPGTNGTLQFSFSGEPERNFAIQSSTDLITWTNAVVLSNSTGTVQFSDTTGPAPSGKFYRASPQ